MRFGENIRMRIEKVMDPASSPARNKRQRQLPCPPSDGSKHNPHTIDPPIGCLARSLILD